MQLVGQHQEDGGINLKINDYLICFEWFPDRRRTSMVPRESRRTMRVRALALRHPSGEQHRQQFPAVQAEQRQFTCYPWLSSHRRFKTGCGHPVAAALYFVHNSLPSRGTKMRALGNY